MNQPILPKQVLRTIHTPAILDSWVKSPKTRADAGFARTTSPIEAVHICGPLAPWPFVCAASSTGSRP